MHSSRSSFNQPEQNISYLQPVSLMPADLNNVPLAIPVKSMGGRLVSEKGGDSAMFSKNKPVSYTALNQCKLSKKNSERFLKHAAQKIEKAEKGEQPLVNHRSAMTDYDRAAIDFEILFNGCKNSAPLDAQRYLGYASEALGKARECIGKVIAGEQNEKEQERAGRDSKYIEGRMKSISELNAAYGKLSIQMDKN